MKRLKIPLLAVIGILLLSACGAPAATPTQSAVPTQPGGNVVGGITNTSVRIVQEQGSGAACTANSTYFVYVDISSNGPTTALYEIDVTDASGQVPDGVFDGFAAPEVRELVELQVCRNAIGLVTPGRSLCLSGYHHHPGQGKRRGMA